MILFSTTHNLRLMVEGPFTDPPLALFPPGAIALTEDGEPPTGLEIFTMELHCTHCGYLAANLIICPPLSPEQIEAGVTMDSQLQGGVASQLKMAQLGHSRTPCPPMPWTAVGKQCPHSGMDYNFPAGVEWDLPTMPPWNRPELAPRSRLILPGYGGN